MSEYCDIFPEDPTCTGGETETPTDDTPVNEPENDTGDNEEGANEEGDNEEVDADEGMDDEMKEEMEEEMMEKMDHMDWDMTPSQMWMKAGELMKFTSIDPFMGTLTYLMVAIGMTTHTALNLFRYEQSDSDAAKDWYSGFATGSDDDYKTGKFDGTNWFKLGDLLTKFTHLAVYGAAAITTILAGFGIAPEINMLVWFYGVFLVGGIVSFVGTILKFLGYETGYSNMEETIMGAFNLGMASNIRGKMIEDTVMETSVALSLYMQMENWHWAAWDALPQELKETQLEELMAEIEEWDAEKMAEMEGEKKEA